jgi:hypothetical protein
VELAVVQDLRQRRVPATPEELASLETDVLAGFVLARASAGLADGTIRADIDKLERLRVDVSLRKRSPAAPTHSTSPPCSASTRRPPSATPARLDSFWSAQLSSSYLINLPGEIHGESPT